MRYKRFLRLSIMKVHQISIQCQYNGDVSIMSRDSVQENTSYILYRCWFLLHHCSSFLPFVHKKYLYFKTLFYIVFFFSSFNFTHFLFTCSGQISIGAKYEVAGEKGNWNWEKKKFPQSSRKELIKMRPRYHLRKSVWGLVTRWWKS